MTSGARPQPNSGTTRDDEAERTGSGSAGKEHEHPKSGSSGKLHEYPESGNEQPESAHGRSALDDQDDDIGCI